MQKKYIYIFPGICQKILETVVGFKNNCNDTSLKVLFDDEWYALLTPAYKAPANHICQGQSAVYTSLDTKQRERNNYF